MTRVGESRGAWLSSNWSPRWYLTRGRSGFQKARGLWEPLLRHSTGQCLHTGPPMAVQHPALPSPLARPEGLGPAPTQRAAGHQPSGESDNGCRISPLPVTLPFTYTHTPSTVLCLEHEDTAVSKTRGSVSRELSLNDLKPARGEKRASRSVRSHWDLPNTESDCGCRAEPP